MDYLFIDLAALLGLWAIPMIWLYAAGFRYILKLAKENEELRERLCLLTENQVDVVAAKLDNDELREINDVLRVKIAWLERHEPEPEAPSAKPEMPKWVRYLFDDTDPRLEKY